MSRRAGRWCGRVLGSRPGQKVSESCGEPLDVRDASLQERIVRVGTGKKRRSGGVSAAFPRPITKACNPCNQSVVACLCKFSQDTGRLAAAAFSRTPCVRTVHLLPLDILH
jgi:hypothetical protein